MFYNFFQICKNIKTLSAKYYQENKERLQKRELMIDIEIFLKKKQKRQYGRGCYENLSEDEKQKLVEYRTNTIEWRNMSNYNYKKHMF